MADEILKNDRVELTEGPKWGRLGLVVGLDGVRARVRWDDEEEPELVNAKMLKVVPKPSPIGFCSWCLLPFSRADRGLIMNVRSGAALHARCAGAVAESVERAKS